MEDIAIRIRPTNRGPDPAPLGILPTSLVSQCLVVGGPRPGPSEPDIRLGAAREGFTSR